MKKTIILGLLVGVFLISGCVQQQETVTCNPPYIKVGNSCCLDQNSNNLCDKDEAPTQLQTYCGDGTCQSDESCSSCPSDCRECQVEEQKAYCGDGICQSTEDCSLCQVDCGQCPSQPKKYDENQIAACEEEYVYMGGEKLTRDECYRSYAVEEDNYQYCNQINGLAERNDCYFTVGIWAKNTYVCGLISSTTSNCGTGEFNCRDACYYNVAIKENDEIICEDIIEQNAKDKCYYVIAKEKLRSYLCSKIVSSEGTISNNYCYYKVAVGANNIDICNPITDARLHDQCMMVIIRSLRLDDLSLCEKMTTVWKSSCQNEITTGNYLD